MQNNATASPGLVCFDDIEDLRALNKSKLATTYERCKRVGMYNHLDVLDKFLTFVETIDDKLECEDKTLNGFIWSDYLAYSASKHLDTFDTLPVNPSQIIDDNNEHSYLKEVATFRNHDRFYYVSARQNNLDVKEMVLDLLLDDDSYNFRLRTQLLSNAWTHIGMACTTN